jgi:hypothetical protein
LTKAKLADLGISKSKVLAGSGLLNRQTVSVGAEAVTLTDDTRAHHGQSRKGALFPVLDSRHTSKAAVASANVGVAPLRV